MASPLSEPAEPPTPSDVVVPAPAVLYAGPLRVIVTAPKDGVLLVCPVGEVDISTERVLRDAVIGATSRAARHVVVDLAGLTFCASVGLVVFVDGRQLASDRGIGFSMAGATPIVRRILDITGLGAVLGLRGDAAEVLGELG